MKYKKILKPIILVLGLPISIPAVLLQILIEVLTFILYRYGKYIYEPTQDLVTKFLEEKKEE